MATGMQLARKTLLLDAVLASLAGFALLIAAIYLAEPVGLAHGWPIAVLGFGLLLFAVLCWWTAEQRLTPEAVLGVVVLDAVFAVAMLVLAVANPTGATPLARWGMVALGLPAAVFGALRWWDTRTVGIQTPT